MLQLKVYLTKQNIHIRLHIVPIYYRWITVDLSLWFLRLPSAWNILSELYQHRVYNSDIQFAIPEPLWPIGLQNEWLSRYTQLCRWKWKVCRLGRSAKDGLLGSSMVPVYLKFGRNPSSRWWTTLPGWHMRTCRAHTVWMASTETWAGMPCWKRREWTAWTWCWSVLSTGKAEGQSRGLLLKSIFDKSWCFLLTFHLCNRSKYGPNPWCGRSHCVAWKRCRLKRICEDRALDASRGTSPRVENAY